jgi:hypothetical protein
MTRRERLERKIERRQEWAAKRQASASAVLNNRPAYASDWAFITQPGHIPARARLIAREEHAYQDMDMAAHHKEKAAGIQTQLDRAIFSDDSDAVEAIEERIKANEAKREQMKKVNALFRKGDAEGLAALGQNYAHLKAIADDPRTVSWRRQPYPAYKLQNLGQRISGDKKRLEAIKAQQSRTAEAAATENGVTIKEHQCGAESYTSVTFAEKPDYNILRALKDAGYRWGSGQWFGLTAKLPACISELVSKVAA